MPEPWACHEVMGAVLPHSGYRSNLSRIAEGLASSCGSSYSVGCGPAGRQAARRLFRLPKTTVNGLLTGHYEQTAARCASHELVLCVQDTTTLNFSSHKSKTGLGRIGSTDALRGLLAHSVMAVTPDGLPLGMLHVKLWAREDGPQTRSLTKRYRSAEEKESFKWIEGLEAVARALPAHQHALLVQDREADIFDLLAAPRRSRLHLLIRACQSRRVELVDADGQPQGVYMRLMAAIERTPVSSTMVVTVPRKPGQPEREARLSVQYCAVNIQPPVSGLTRKSDTPQAVTLVRALEVEPPTGAEPIHWLLLTTMPVADTQEAQRMVGYYKQRWQIERLHYTLKSGCNVERLQIDNGHALRNALGVYFMVAWRIMWLTHMARVAPDTPAEEVLQADELHVLREAAPRPVETVEDALREIARLVGYEHYANAPPPGVKRIWQGLRYLEALTYGWNLAQRARNVNQD